MTSGLLSFFLAAVALLESRFFLSVALEGDCPLDISWSNLTLVASICSDQSARAKCCRYINALVAVSVSRHVNAAGELGVPPAFSDICVNNISESLTSSGIPPNATTFCGLGTKIQVSYQCRGIGTVSDMLQSPNFDDVVRNCKMPLFQESSCRRCLNSGLSFLRHLVGEQDNVTLNTCRDAAFVALASQGNNFSDTDIASCFFSVEGLSFPQVNSSEPPSQSIAPAILPSPAAAPSLNLRTFDIHVKEHHHSYQLSLIPGIGIMITGLAILLLVILIILIRKKSQELDNEMNHIGNSSGVSSTAHVWKNKGGASTIFRRYSYKETKRATNNFSAIVGRGGVGTVYKAHFDNSLNAIVTQLQNISIQSEKHFCRDIEILGRLHHRHLVAFRGFCFTKPERFIIYEFLENGSLKDQLHSSGISPLTWQTRIQIAIDVANALEYLHCYCDPPLWHGNIKSSSIFLDKNFVAKVAYSGLAHFSSSACCFLPNKSHAQGAPGFLDPEYLATQQLNEKNDIFSYGLLLLELVTGKQATHDAGDLVELYQEIAATNYRLPELVDPKIGDAFDLEQLEVVVGIIGSCIQVEGRERPSIKQILRMLYEGCDPMHIGFARAVEDEGGSYGAWLRRQQEYGAIALSGDARFLQSSSSTSRSYCSRSSLLLVNGSPRSPHGIASSNNA